MRRRVRWVVIGVAALVIAGAAAALVVVKPDLARARDRVDLRWTPLREPLDTRYQTLAGVATALDSAGAADRAATLALDDALARWSKLALRGPKHTNAAVEAKTANELEALARRVRANIAGSDRLAANPAVTGALLAFDQAVVPVPTITAYNRAVRQYEDERSGTIRRLVADAFSYEPRSLLLVGG
jgi:hypothetical protein